MKLQFDDVFKISASDLSDNIEIQIKSNDFLVSEATLKPVGIESTKAYFSSEIPPL